MYDALINSGFCFLKEVDHYVIMEHWYTGLWVKYDTLTDTYEVIEEV